MPAQLICRYSTILFTRQEWMDQYATLAGHLDGLPLPAPVILRQDNPDAICLIARGGTRVTGHCCLWWSHTPPASSFQHASISDNQKHKDMIALCPAKAKEGAVAESVYQQMSTLALIGHFAAADRESALELLDFASKEPKKRGATMVAGPMDGSTWGRYRFITWRGDEPIFFLEPDNDANYPLYFAEAGFKTICNYYSSISEHLDIFDDRSKQIERRLRTAGVSVRSLRADDYEGELRRLYSVCLQSFRHNPFYTPIAEQAFLRQYMPLKDLIDSRLVLIAERQGKAIGFNFTLPDNSYPGSIIVKTLARLPERTYAGAGNLLLALSQQRALELGYKRVIHALFHEANKSANLSLRHARVMRRYSLFARGL